MCRAVSLLVVVLVAATDLTRVEAQCASQCTCDVTENKITCTGASNWPQDPIMEAPKRLEVVCADGVSIPRITKSHFENYPHLTHLIINKCGIEDIADDAFEEVLTELQVISLPFNKLTSIHQNTFSALYNLTNVYLEGNKIEEIPDNAFIHLHKLKVIRLSSNNLRKIGKHAFEDLDHMTNLYIESNPNLTFVDPEAFLYSKIDFVTIGGCNLDENFVDALMPLNYIRQLRWNLNVKPLNFNANTFSGMSFRYLDLSGNQLTNLDFLENVVCEHLILNTNNFTHLDLSPYTLNKTFYISFRYNKVPITNVDVSKWSHLDLEYVYLDNSQIEVVSGTFSSNTNLRVVRISQNNLKAIPDGFLRKNSKLSRVELEDNAIEVINGGMFPHTDSLLYIEVYNNKIATIPDDMEGALDGMMKDVNGYFAIHDNPLHCNCEIKWIRLLMKRKTNLLTKTGYSVDPFTNCTSPNTVDIASINPEDMICQPPYIKPITSPEGDSDWLCDVSADPAPTLQWMDKDGNVLASRIPNSRGETQMALLLPQHDVTGDGFSCKATNSRGEATARVLVSASAPGTAAACHWAFISAIGSIGVSIILSI